MGFLEKAKKKYEDVTGQTKAKETDRLIVEYAQVLHGYADRLETMERLYDNLRNGHMDLRSVHDRVRVLALVAVASCVLSVAALAVSLLK